MRKDKHRAAVNLAIAGDEPVSLELVVLHPEVGAAVGDELIGLLERCFIEQEFDTFPGRHPTGLAMFFEAIQAPAFVGELAAALEFRQLLFKFHGGTIIAGGGSGDR